MFKRRAKAREAVSSHTAPVSGARAASAEPRVEYYSGTVIEPEEGAAFRIDSAADVDPNVKAHGVDGVPRGGAGGYGGAGTK